MENNNEMYFYWEKEKEIKKQQEKKHMLRVKIYSTAPMIVTSISLQRCVIAGGYYIYLRSGILTFFFDSRSAPEQKSF